MTPVCFKQFDAQQRQIAAEKLNNFGVLKFYKDRIHLASYDDQSDFPSDIIELVTLAKGHLVVHVGSAEEASIILPFCLGLSCDGLIDFMRALMNIDHDPEHLATYSVMWLGNPLMHDDSIAVFLHTIDEHIKQAEQEAAGDSVDAINSEMRLEVLREIRAQTSLEDDDVPGLRRDLEEKCGYVCVKTMVMGQVPSEHVYTAHAAILRAARWLIGAENVR